MWSHVKCKCSEHFRGPITRSDQTGSGSNSRSCKRAVLTLFPANCSAVGAVVHKLRRFRNGPITIHAQSKRTEYLWRHIRRASGEKFVGCTVIRQSLRENVVVGKPISPITIHAQSTRTAYMHSQVLPPSERTKVACACTCCDKRKYAKSTFVKNAGTLTPPCKSCVIVAVNFKITFCQAPQTLWDASYVVGLANRVLEIWAKTFDPHTQICRCRWRPFWFDPRRQSPWAQFLRQANSVNWFGTCRATFPTRKR